MGIHPNMANQFMCSIPEPAYLSLHTAEPGLVGANELTCRTYIRQPLTLTRASGGIRQTTAVVTFPMLQSPTVTHVGLWSDEEDGRLMWTAALEAPRSLGSNDTLFFEAGELEFGLITGV